MLPVALGLTIVAACTAALVLAARRLAKSLAQHVRPPPRPSRYSAHALTLAVRTSQGHDTGYTLSARGHVARRGSF